MTDEPKAVRILKDFETLKSERCTYESAWRDIRQFVRPNTVDFNSSRSPGDVRTEKMHDGTAMQACVDLSGDVWTELFNPVERSYAIGVMGGAEINRIPEVIEWCDYVADEIFEAYADESSQLVGSGFETIQDIVAFGNGIISQEWDVDNQHLIFNARALAQCYFRTDRNGLVNVLFRTEEWELRNIRARWPQITWEGIDRLPQEQKFNVIHAVQPRGESERIYGRRDGRNMPFASCWVLQEKKLLLEEGGYESFPYHCPRWNKVADETYGRGPGINCLPNIRMLNRMKITTVRAAQKATDPTVWLPSEGVRLPYKDFPGGVNHYDPSMFPNGFDLQSVEHKGNFPVTLEMMEAERLAVRKAFYTDWLEWFPKVERQTAEEIRELSLRKLKKMSPLLGRLETEMRVPMIQRSFGLLSKAGRIPPAPAIMQGRTLRILYISASAKAQDASVVNGLIGYMQQLIPLAQVDPTVLDAVDIKKFAAELAIKQHISRRILRTEDEIAQIEQDRAEQEQATALAGAAEPVSKALLNVAKANEAGGIAI